MPLAILPTAECHLDGLYAAFDAVARERQYLASFQAPAKEAWLGTLRTNIARDLCQFVAVDDEVLGWCDVLPAPGEARTHVGVLTIGVLPPARGRGIGAMLMEAAIDQAWAKGLRRIQLTVRADNSRATSLYERFGFATEGVLRQDFCVDGRYFDGYLMALLRR
ncbi:GNAT family N-acetyltransferase [Parasulfuritortus cantonensis]|uniref:GNAT family N-acetyltransferase n=1 Tax=Parasulfuritortus cantonensis TaxID=2528202 RepID=A0A4R1B8T0_9PROT|nr:GNAT family N-acetyltransferase [Parasulfuritortus cantonensis]TCJ12743.1 GNAT family N-acetyltransferase [Parasulfuritortus cantonensis]